MDGPLEGIRVVDLTTYLSGPFCTAQLAALGADVIKVELPGRGDPTRHQPPFVGPKGVSSSRRSPEDESLTTLKRSRNKRSISLNLKTPRGRELLRELVQRSDVLVENARPGAMQRLGLDYASLATIHPRLVYCSLSAFGQTGPLSDQPGYDVVIQAMSGAMEVTGEPDGPPLRCGVTIGDLVPGLYAALAVVAAIRRRDQTGEGDYLDVAMLDTLLAMVWDDHLDFWEQQGLPPRRANRSSRIAPFNAYRTLDGYVVLAVFTEAQWNSLLRAMGRSDLDERAELGTVAGRFEHEREVEDMVADWASQWKSAELVEWLASFDLVASPVLHVDEVPRHPQVQSRDMLRPAVHATCGSIDGVLAPEFPLRFSRARTGWQRPAPALGQDNSEVYETLLGHSAEELAAWTADGII